MFECLIIGDSIAVGTKMFAPAHCESYSKGGWNTWQWNQKWGMTPLDANIVVISLGTNDHKYIKTEAELRKIRERVHSNKVVWVMPPCNEVFCKQNVNDIVAKIAGEYQDLIVRTKQLQVDHIHPNWAGYKEIVKQSGISGD